MKPVKSVRALLPLPRAGQTVYSHYGRPLHVIRATLQKGGCRAECWEKGERIVIDFKADGSMVNRSLQGFTSDDYLFQDCILYKRFWHHNRKKALSRNPMIRILPTGWDAPKHKIRIATAKAPVPGEYKTTSYLDSLAGSCSARADAQVFVTARVIDDPHNPQNNGRDVVMTMPKSRVDGLYSLAKDLKELK